MSENWRKNNLHYYPYYGRGYVQLTWKRNYEEYSGIFNIDLAKKPDKALQHDIALFVLAHGMKLGIFTGRPLEKYINENETDFFNARRVINGMDKASEIKKIAEDYLDQL